MLVSLTFHTRRFTRKRGESSLFQSYASYGGRAFYEERAPGADNFNLMVRDAKGTRTLVNVSAIRASHGGTPYAINYFLASPDGKKVAVGISQGGSEAASMFVYDAASGKQMAGPIDRADFGATSWSNDSKLVYFIRLKQLAPGEDQINKYKNATADVWDMKSTPVAVAGNGIGTDTSFAPDETPAVQINPGSPVALLASINGVQNEVKLWSAPAQTASNPNAPWKPFVDRSDDVTRLDIRGNDVYLLSHHNAPTFQVLHVKAGAPLSTATVVVPAQADRVIEDVHAASDGLYVSVRHGAYSQLLRVPPAARKSKRSRCRRRVISRKPSAIRARPGSRLRFLAGCWRLRNTATIRRPNGSPISSSASTATLTLRISLSAISKQRPMTARWCRFR